MLDDENRKLKRLLAVGSIRHPLTIKASVRRDQASLTTCKFELEAGSQKSNCSISAWNEKSPAQHPCAAKDSERLIKLHS
jgi:hypothetical protein